MSRLPATRIQPRNEQELIAIVRSAAERGGRVRVVGAAHSEPAAITEPDAVLCDLSRMRSVELSAEDERGLLVAAEAGINLGRNPYDPSRTSTWGNSLNLALRRRGRALPDLGGITHQTVGGFLSTGSSGGSVMYSLGDAVERIRFVDGRGEVHEVSRGEDRFCAAAVSLGLLGVITKVWFRVGPDFNIAGQQTTRSTADTPIDFFGDRADLLPFERYLAEAPYARLMWWPQLGFDRMVVWQAQRMRPTPGFVPKPYQELGGLGRVASLAGSLVYTILGNLDDLGRVPAKLEHWYRQLDDVIEGDPDPNACPDALRRLERVSLEQVLGFIGRGLANVSVDSPDSALSLLSRAGRRLDRSTGGAFSDLFVEIVRLILSATMHSDVAKELGKLLEGLMPQLIGPLLGLFVSDDGPAGPQIFQDSWMCGLPMDNQMDDQLWPTVFTELWLPIERSREVMSALRTFYRADGDRDRSYRHTGAFSCEIYAAKASPFWLSPAFERDSLRIDVFWFGRNAGDPSAAFFPRFWQVLAPFGLRPHWGKVLPHASDAMRAHYRRELPRLVDFLALRQELDPRGVFATAYWRDHLGF